MFIVNPNERLADTYQKAANSLSWLRVAAAPIIAERILTSENSYRGWLMAGGIAVLGATDKVDGWLGRKAAKLRFGLENTRGAWLDQLSDKVFVHGILGSLAVKEAIDGNKGLAAVYGINQAVILARDMWVTNVRSEASRQDIDIKARSLGKLKTAAQIATLSAITAPIFDSHEAGSLAIQAGAVTATTALAIASGVSLARELHNNQERVKEPIS